MTASVIQSAFIKKSTSLNLHRNVQLRRADEDSKEDDKDGVEEENKKKSIEDDDEKKKGDKSKDEKSKPRVMILSCIYSDQNHCGYILERDLEEILYTIGVIYQGLR
ncbi:cell division cycle and apoptosis regulator protein 1-like [Lytechinus pictus]|uniref:cell division cycle and apoptosis regulator protein 1-like n=1 Tax=Lytechinus pictus TaxID=7653 RepID=UPI0030BA1BA2